MSFQVRSWKSPANPNHGRASPVELPIATMPGTTRYSATFDRTYEEDVKSDPATNGSRRSRSQSLANVGIGNARPYTPLGNYNCRPSQRSSSTDSGDTKGEEQIPTRTTSKTVVKTHNNPFQFVKVGSCPLYRKVRNWIVILSNFNCCCELFVPKREGGRRSPYTNVVEACGRKGRIDGLGLWGILRWIGSRSVLPSKTKHANSIIAPFQLGSLPGASGYVLSNELQFESQVLRVQEHLQNRAVLSDSSSCRPL